jgi:hypothetical protein
MILVLIRERPGKVRYNSKEPGIDITLTYSPAFPSSQRCKFLTGIEFSSIVWLPSLKYEAVFYQQNQNALCQPVLLELLPPCLIRIETTYTQKQK